MGRTCFIAPIASEDDLRNAILSIVRHNTSAIEPLGYYTDAEYQALDPIRFKHYKSLVDAGLNPVCNFNIVSLAGPLFEQTIPVPLKSTRGEDIVPGGCCVYFKKKLWLEVKNFGGGCCSTTWLKTNSPQVGWIGTEGKPAGFYQAPCIGETDTMPGLVALGMRCLNTVAFWNGGGDAGAAA